MAFKSKFEQQVAKWLRKRKFKFDYEKTTFPFVQPAKERSYTPDFGLSVSGVFVECKGKLTKEDREKLIWAREQNPNLRLIILFQRANNVIRKGSKTRYRDWADKNGFEWCDWESGQLKPIKDLSR